MRCMDTGVNLVELLRLNQSNLDRRNSSLARVGQEEERS